MASISSKFDHKILDSIPDFTDWELAQQWIEEGQKLFEQSAVINPSDAEIVSLDWGQIQESSKLPFGLYSSVMWRKFVLAVFLADYISYAQPVDRVSFERLLFVMHVFPAGFRIWWTKFPHGRWWPVGYSGWYPMLETAFDVFEKAPHKLKDRTVVPCEAEVGNSFLYLFNYSVAPKLKGSALSKMLMTGLAADIAKQKPAGLACITVSEDGVRIAKRFGMSHAGDLVMDGCVEGVYTGR